MGAQLDLFYVPITGLVTGKKRRRPPELPVNKVNHELAPRRYYLHKQLKKYPAIEFNGTERWIKCAVASFEELPVGARYYIKKLMEEFQYNVQYLLVDVPKKEKVKHDNS